MADIQVLQRKLQAMMEVYAHAKAVDRKAYASRNLVERLFGRVKEFRRVATGYDKRARNFLSAVILAEARCLLRGLANAIN